jgi:hypothetical protein
VGGHVWVAGVNNASRPRPVSVHQPLHRAISSTTQGTALGPVRARGDRSFHTPIRIGCQQDEMRGDTDRARRRCWCEYRDPSAGWLIRSSSRPRLPPRFPDITEAELQDPHCQSAQIDQEGLWDETTVWMAPTHEIEGGSPTCPQSLVHVF